MDNRSDNLKFTTPDYDDGRWLLYATKTSSSHFKLASARLRDNKKIVSNIAKVSPSILEHASNRIKDDFDIMSQALSRCGYIINYASPSLKDNPKFIMQALKHNPNLIMCASERLRQDKEFVISAIEEIGGSVFLSISDCLRDDPDILKLALGKLSSVEIFKRASWLEA
jgi:hypothetical protein